MESLRGFVTLPRLAGQPRPAGAFFSATVEGPTGPGAWRVRLEGRTQVVSTSLALEPGQTLRLKSLGLQGGRWLLQVLPGPGASPSPTIPDALMAAFVSRGLPLAAETLGRWGRWVAQAPGAPSDREGWAAGLEARGEAPNGPTARALEPWLAWQTALERGEAPPLPDEEFWDHWNLRTPAGEPWLVVPLRWVYEGQSDAGLLQAHWNAPAQTIDRWSLTAAPASVPFRLEARVTRGLELVWRFFRPEDRALWAPRAVALVQGLSSPELEVTLRVAGPDSEGPGPLGGVDVQA